MADRSARWIARGANRSSDGSRFRGIERNGPQLGALVFVKSFGRAERTDSERDLRIGEERGGVGGGGGREAKNGQQEAKKNNNYSRPCHSKLSQEIESELR